jgi:hypothetical protein
MAICWGLSVRDYRQSKPIEDTIVAKTRGYPSWQWCQLGSNRASRLVYRQVSGLSEVLRLLEQEGLMWAGVIQVSKQALSNRLRDIPAQLFAQMFEQVVTRSSQQVTRLVPTGWEVARI